MIQLFLNVQRNPSLLRQELELCENSASARLGIGLRLCLVPHLGI